ncbi:MAG: hypothetical protein OXQ92_04455 [Boseongicola sp.]|nr:hypothetical protein [Boseongicola sp.]MDD9979633.1 hypothetical protein [Boseongicola sp.]
MGKSGLLEAFEEFDGIRTEPLKKVLGGCVSSDVLPFIPGPHEIPATWFLLKLAKAGSVSLRDAEVAAQRLPQIQSADAVLHVLQMAQHLPDAYANSKTAIAPLLEHKRILIRVWALDALVRADPAAPELIGLIDNAAKDSSAAMRARARQLMPLLVKTIG